MDIAQFREIVSSFLDSADHVQWSKGVLVAQIGAEMIEAEIRTRNGSLLVAEGDREQAAETWVVHRLARLDTLAERIIASMPPKPAFVVPQGEIVDEIERVESDAPVKIPDAVEGAREFLNRRPAGTCSVLYLTSGAGEGKTTLIEHLARVQAEQFRARTSDWLLVPIGLGGRPFLRFDDVVMAAFMNQLRFQRLYYSSFIQLVRLGVIVPALDGFEEIFVETSDGEAVTGLGTLIGQMGGEGTLLVAARTAFFEVRRLEAQAKLLDALPSVDATFGRVSLCRWSKTEFLDYCTQREFQHSDDLYSSLSARLGEAHPLLTRAVLVRRIVDLATEQGSDFVQSIPEESTKWFRWLVETLLKRESTEKWIDKFGDPPRPLLTVVQHQELLGMLSEEMWISKTAVLSDRMVDSIAEIYAEGIKLRAQSARQIRERLSHHALVAEVGAGGREFSFDHDDFREFFLGRQLAEHLVSNRSADVRKIIRIDVLPSFAVDSTVAEIRERIDISASLVQRVAEASRAEKNALFVKENAGSIIVRLLELIDGPVEVSDVAFPVDSLRGRRIGNVSFVRCLFQRTSLERTALSNCKFVDCEFELLEVDGHRDLTNCEIAVDSRVRVVSYTRAGESVDEYDPAKIRQILVRAGFALPIQDPQSPDTQERETGSDERMKIVEKVVQTFQRTTQVNEGVFRLRLSLNAHRFLHEMLPDLLSAGLLVERAEGASVKYRLGMRMGQIADALRVAAGSYDQFLEAVRSTQKN